MAGRRARRARPAAAEPATARRRPDAMRREQTRARTHAHAVSHVKGEAERRKGWQLPSKADRRQSVAAGNGLRWQVAHDARCVRVVQRSSATRWSCELAGVPPSNSNGASKTPFLVENGVFCPCPGVWGSVLSWLHAFCGPRALFRCACEPSEGFHR